MTLSLSPRRSADTSVCVTLASSCHAAGVSSDTGMRARARVLGRNLSNVTAKLAAAAAEGGTPEGKKDW